MGILETWQAIERVRAIAIVRIPAIAPDAAVAIVETLVKAGLGVVEFTLNTDDALPAIERVAGQVDGCVVGAGTVVTLDQAQRAMDAGAQLLVAPGTEEEVIAAAVANDVLPLPGAFTATEVVRATSAGAPAVKLFPAGPVGPGYLAAIRAPLPEVPLVPTGGIGLDEIGPFLEAGAAALGLGSCLVRSADAGDGLASRAADVRARIDAA